MIHARSTPRHHAPAVSAGRSHMSLSLGAPLLFPSPLKGRVAPISAFTRVFDALGAPGGGPAFPRTQCLLRDPHPTRFAGRPPPCRGGKAESALASSSLAPHEGRPGAP